MFAYYSSLILIIFLFLGLVFFLLKSIVVIKNKKQRCYIIGLSGIITVLVCFSYGYYGAFKPLRSLYAYRDIHDLLQSFQTVQDNTPGKVDKALTTLYQKLPQTEYVHAKMGEVYLALSLYAKAECAYQRAVNIKSYHRDYLYGYYYAQSLNYHGALPEKSVYALAAILKNYPKDNGLLNLLAVHYFQKNNFKEAIIYWQRIRTDNPEEANLIQQMIGRAQVQLGPKAMPEKEAPRILLNVKWAYPEVKRYPVIFLVVKYPNEAMPVLVKRLNASQDIILNQEQQYILSNQDALEPSRGIALGQKLIISVRGSVSGMADKSNKDKVVESEAVLMNTTVIETKIIF